MPDFNLNPSISDIGLFIHFFGDEGLDPFLNFEKVPCTFELVMKFTLSGMKYLKNPISNAYAPFYLNIVSYTQRGQRDIVTHGLVTEFFDEERLIRNQETLEVYLNTFYNSPEMDGYSYDFISNIYFVEIFLTSYEIKNTQDLERELFDHSNPNRLYRTKVPYVNCNFEGETNG